MNRLSRLSQSFKRSWDDVFIRNHPFPGLGGEDVKSSPYSRSNIAFVCISTTARAISQVPLQIGKKNRSGAFIPLPPNDPWTKLLNRPNYLMDRYSFTEAIVSYLLLDGNIWVLPFPPGVSTASAPTAIFVLPRRYMEPVKGQGNNLLGWHYKPYGAQIIPIAFDEVSHIKFFNPDDPIIGQRPLDAGELPLLGDYKAQKFNNNFFDEGAVPFGVLSAERSLTKTQREHLRTEFENRHKGFQQSHRLAVLEGGLKYTRVGLSHEDMQFLNLRKYTRDEILQVFGMKKAVISVTDDLNFATAREQRREWWEGTNLPIMRLIEASLSYSIFQDSGIDLEFQFDINSIEALQEQFKDKVNAAYRLWTMGIPFNAINSRLHLGFKEIPWGDRGFVPLNLAPVNDDGTTNATTSGDDKTDPGTPQQINPPADGGEEEKPKQVKLLPQAISKRSEEREAKIQAIWDNLIKRIQPLEDAYYLKIKKVLFQMRQKTLQSLYKKSVEDVFSINYEAEQALLEKYSSGYWVKAAEEGVNSVIEEIGISIDWDLSNPIAIEFMAMKVSLIREVTEEIKKGIIEICSDALESGRSIDEIATLIREEFTDLTKWRAEAIARTEIMSCANFGRFVGIANSGFLFKEWWTAQDTKVRDEHIPMDGTIISALGQEMWVFPDGSFVRFPGDPLGQAHQTVNCRCIEVVADTNEEIVSPE